METDTKRRFMIAVAIVCIALAAAISYSTHPRLFHRHRNWLDSIPKDEMIWVKCANEECGAEYQMNRRTYFKSLRESPYFEDYDVDPPLICKECGKASIYKAMKCEKCGGVFFPVSVSKDWGDRCPACGYSKIEALKKAKTQNE